MVTIRMARGVLFLANTMNELEKMKAAAKAVGLIYNGLQHGGRSVLALFTDRRHGSTIAVAIDQGVDGLRQRVNAKAVECGMEAIV